MSADINKPWKLVTELNKNDLCIVKGLLLYVC